MDYETAKRLKDAGYDGGNHFTGDADTRKFLRNTLTREETYVPTLSELIEACGGAFEDLCLLGEGDEFQWYCTTQEGERIYGFTPEIAVANLWLAINKK